MLYCYMMNMKFHAYGDKAGQKIKIFDFLTVHLRKYAAHTYKSDKDKKN